MGAYFSVKEVQVSTMAPFVFFLYEVLIYKTWNKLVLFMFPEEVENGKTELGIWQLVGITAGPVVVLCVIFVTVFILYHRCQSRKHSIFHPVEPIDTPLLPDGQPNTLTEMMYEYSGSGSGRLI